MKDINFVPHSSTQNNSHSRWLFISLITLTAITLSLISITIPYVQTYTSLSQQVETLRTLVHQQEQLTLNQSTIEKKHADLLLQCNQLNKHIHKVSPLVTALEHIITSIGNTTLHELVINRKSIELRVESNSAADLTILHQSIIKEKIIDRAQLTQLIPVNNSHNLQARITAMTSIITKPAMID